MTLYFKRYESFLEKLAMGVAGVKKVMEVLESQGHQIIPAEKGTLSFKIWRLKTKRFRVPDLLCIKCDRAFEVRSKSSKIEISMSHSTSDLERSWNYGLRNEYDYVAFVACNKHGPRPVDWIGIDPVIFVPVKKLNEEYKKGNFIMSSPKGREEGYEKRIIWPARIAEKDGIIRKINDNYIYLSYLESKRILKRDLNFKKDDKIIKLKPLKAEGEYFKGGEPIASVISVEFKVPCDKYVSIDYFIKMLNSTSKVERFMAAKALRYFDESRDKILSALKDALEKESEDLVKLEIAASIIELESNKENEGYKFIEDVINMGNIDPLRAHEAILTLAEIDPKKTFNLLKDVLINKDLPEEVRASSAWVLGETNPDKALPILINIFKEQSRVVKEEAARTLLQIVSRYKEYYNNILCKFCEPDTRIREGLSWVLAKLLEREGKIEEKILQDILDLIIDEDTKIWVSYILGIQEPEKYDNNTKEIIKQKDPEVFFAVNVLWVILRSWIWELGEY